MTLRSRMLSDVSIRNAEHESRQKIYFKSFQKGLGTIPRQDFELLFEVR